MRSILLLLTLLLVGCIVAGSAGAQANVEREVNLLMARGDYDGALQRAESGWPADTPNRAQRLDFIRAMKLKAQGRYDDAAAALRAIIAADPDFGRVRAELAHTLFLAGDYDAARFHFSDLSRNADSTRAREGFESYLSAIRSRQPYRLSGYVSLAPSTNINNRTTSRHVVIDGLPFELAEDSRAASGIGLSGGLTGQRNFFFGEDVTLTFSGSVDATKYKTARYDRLQVATSAFLRRRTGRNMFGIGLVGDYYNLGHRSFRQGGGLAFEAGRTFEGGRQIFASMRVLRQRFPDHPVYDGYRATGLVQLRQPIASGHSLTAGLRMAVEDTQADHLDHVEAGLFIAHAREWRGGLITHVEPQIALRRYGAADPVFGARRRDTEIGATIRLMHRKLNFNGFAPRLEYSYMRNISNIPLRNRDSHDLNVVLTREF